MKTLLLIVKLVAVVVWVTFLMFFIPWCLNAHSFMLNLMGGAVLVGHIIVFVAYIHRRLTM